MENSISSIDSQQGQYVQKIDVKPLPKDKKCHHTSLIYGAQFFSNKNIFKRCRSFKAELLENVDKETIFQKVYKFIDNLITDKNYFSEIIMGLQYKENRQNISIEIIDNQSLKQLQDESAEEVRKSIRNSIQFSFRMNEQSSKGIKQTRRQNVSILLNNLSNNNSLSDFGSSLFSSEQVIKDFKSFKLTEIPICKQKVEEILEEPEPFLINLSMCLMLKFLYCSKIQIDEDNWNWIVSISTIIGYKIYYDDAISGLMQSFSKILNISKENLKDMEVYFLDQISYQAVISQEQYQKVLSKIMTV